MLDPIVSPQNPKIRYVRRLLSERRFRDREKAYVVEGKRWVGEVIAAALSPLLWLAAEEWVAANPALTEALTRLDRPPLIVAAGLLAETAGTETPSGVLAVLPQAELPWPEAPTLLLVLDRLRDPGNAGTLLRSAGAAGVEGVIFAPQTVDPYNPKVVRSSMGAHLRLPLRQANWAEINRLTAGCLPVIAAGEGDCVYSAWDWTAPAALVVGGEAFGASEEARERARAVVAIPMHRQTESLNAAVAGSVILFEAARQRGIAVGR